MSRASTEQVRALIIDILADDLAALGIDATAVNGAFDLRAEGVVDSLGFLELIAALEAELGVEIDFDDIDPAQLTVVEPLAAHVADQLGAIPTQDGGAVALGS